jgi:hypothetical protein
MILLFTSLFLFLFDNNIPYCSLLMAGSLCERNAALSVDSMSLYSGLVGRLLGWVGQYSQQLAAALRAEEAALLRSVGGARGGDQAAITSIVHIQVIISKITAQLTNSYKNIERVLNS